MEIKYVYIVYSVKFDIIYGAKRFFFFFGKNNNSIIENRRRVRSGNMPWAFRFVKFPKAIEPFTRTTGDKRIFNDISILPFVVRGLVN